MKTRPGLFATTHTGNTDSRRIEAGVVLRRLLWVAICLTLPGCVAVGATLAGLGFSNQVSGIQYRTFTEPLSRVSRATLTAFTRMAIKVETVEQTKYGQLFKATAPDRQFEVQLEVITPNTTRMRSLTRNRLGIIVDAPTALEIINQAQKALEPRSSRKRS